MFFNEENYYVDIMNILVHRPVQRLSHELIYDCAPLNLTHARGKHYPVFCGYNCLDVFKNKLTIYVA